MIDWTQPTPEDTAAAIKVAQKAGFVFLVKKGAPQVRRSGYRGFAAARGKPLRKATKGDLEGLTYDVYPVAITRRCEEYDAVTDVFVGGKKSNVIGTYGLDTFVLVRAGFDWTNLGGNY
jgi:hypothetical protein